MRVPAPHPRRLRSLGRLALVVVAVDLFLAVVMSGGPPPRPTVSAQTLPPPTTAAPAPTTPTVTVVLQRPGRPPLPLCFLETTTPARRGALLGGRASFAPYAGVAELLAVLTTTGVTAPGAVIPLTVAYFGATDRLVSVVSTVPCPGGATACPTYPPAGPYRLALVGPSRTFDGLGLVAGTTAQAMGAC